ncbi:ATP-binding protein [Kovacikia minuta CCNUW1]|uniref:ATP-binding protein n=1 Tax=Kovacikia minuta TaxID=2931930 RepID=UPI001CCB9FE8|nr:ATP-binding protein [Kovacikia minuta]UBF24576.1 ATP-binding protein [Kovacikia minuta CCNUW1]
MVTVHQSEQNADFGAEMDASAAIVQTVEPESYQLVLKNSPNELNTLTDWINQLANQLQLSANTAFRLEITLAEAITNIIDYAYDDDAEHEIVVLLDYLENTATIELKDGGRPFNPLQHPAVVLPNSLEEATEGGLGIHLIRSYVDECSYRREDNHNVFTLVIHDSEG